MTRQEFKDYLIGNGWHEESAEREASSIYDNPTPADTQDIDGDLWD